MQNGHFGSKIKNATKHAKNVSTTHCSCSMQKTVPKNSLYWKNETILKIAKNGFCKMVTLAQKLKMQKYMLKTFLQHIAVDLCIKRLQKTANIGKIRPF